MVTHVDMPNFLIIGAPKAGTTSLFQYLRMHPDIFLSSLKEPNFYALEGKEVNYQGPDDKRGNQCRITNIRDYQALFSKSKQEHARGEASTVYLYSEHAAKNIAHHTPQMKLIAILRNPIDLAYSAFLHMQREGREPCQTFEQALQQEKYRIQNNWAPLWHLTAQGFYAAQLKRYYQHFPKQQIKIFFYEDWQKEPQNILKEIQQFIGVDSNIVLDNTKRFNESGKPKSMWLHQLLTKNNVIKKMLKPLLSKRFRRNMMATFTKKNLAPSEQSPMLAETRQTLQQLFSQDIKDLEKLTGKNLSQWLNQP